MSKGKVILRYLYTVFGVFFVGLGIAIAKHGNLGISPVSSIANVISIKFPVFSIGTWVMLWNCVMLVMQIVILRKDFKLIQFLQFPLSLLLGWFTDVNLAWVSSVPADIYIVKLSLVLCSSFVLAIGVIFMLVSDTVMNVGEALVNVIAQKLNKNFGTVKVVFDITIVSLSVILSFVFFGKLEGTREGTIITACLTGTNVKLLTKVIRKPLTKLIAE